MHGELREIEIGEESGGFSLHGCSSNMTLFPSIWSSISIIAARMWLQLISVEAALDSEIPESNEPYPEEDSDYPQQQGEDSGYELCFLCGHCSTEGGEGNE
nr:uncharacterized protein LOC9272192 [Oryza sativa Japonica Group]